MSDVPYRKPPTPPNPDDLTLVQRRHLEELWRALHMDTACFDEIGLGATPLYRRRADDGTFERVDVTDEIRRRTRVWRDSYLFSELEAVLTGATWRTKDGM